MNCAKAQSLMLDHLYGDLKPRSERALLRHLQECSKCSEEFKKHKATASSFANLDMEEPPAGISAQLVAMAAEDIEKQKSTRTIFSGWNWKPVFASVAMASLAIFIVVRYVPRSEYPGTRDLMMKSRSEAVKQEALIPAAAPSPHGTVLESEGHEELEGEASLKYRKTAKKATKEDGLKSDLSALSEDESNIIILRDTEQPKRKGGYGLDNDSFGDDIAADKITSTESKNMERGLVGGKAGEVAEPDSGRHARLPQATPPAEKELRALGYLDSSTEPSGWEYSKDFNRHSRVGEEGSRARADGPEPTSRVEADYAEVNVPSTINEVTQPAVAAKPESKSIPKKAPAPPKPAEMKEEEPITVGGSIIVADSLEPDLEIAQEEQLRGNGSFFDSREFNAAVMDSEKAINGKLDRQLAADYKYKLGKTFQEQDDCEKALAVYETIPNEHPDFDNMAEVYISIGECYYDLVDVPNRYNTVNLENAKRSLAIVREKFPETSNARLEKLQESISMQEELLFEYAYAVAKEGLLEKLECDTAKALLKAMPDDRSNPQIRLKQRDALIGVYFAISRCHVAMGEFEDAISVLRIMHASFPEEQETAMQKIAEITAAQTAVRKANEQPPSAAVESSGEKTE
jgi:tetratricopeptide (TPR) repeat protein